MLISFLILLLVVVVAGLWLMERISANTAQTRMAEALIVSSSGQAMGTFWLGVIATLAVVALIGILAYVLFTKLAEREVRSRAIQQQPQTSAMQPSQPKADPMTMMAMMMAASVMQNMQQRPINTHQVQQQYQIPDDVEVTNGDWWQQ